MQDPADVPEAWYGQSIVPPGETLVGIAKGAYCGKDLLVFGSGRAAIMVQRFSASKLIRRYDAIDLVDLDVQGEEFSVIYGAMEALNDRVRRLHIGTHSREIEENLRALLRANRWQCLRDYPCLQTNETPFGAIPFGDGIQTWINPRLTS